MRKRLPRIVATALFCAVLITGVVLLVSHKMEKNTLQAQLILREEAIAELERNEGTYDTQSIVLYNTSRAKVE